MLQGQMLFTQAHRGSTEMTFGEYRGNAGAGLDLDQCKIFGLTASLDATMKGTETYTFNRV